MSLKDHGRLGWGGRAQFDFPIIWSSLPLFAFNRAEQDAVFIRRGYPKTDFENNFLCRIISQKMDIEKYLIL